MLKLREMLKNTISFRLCLIAICIILILGNAGNSYAREPSRAEIEEYVQGQAGHLLEVKDVEFKHFEGSDEGSGRIAGEYTAVLQSDLYLRDNRNYLEGELRRNVKPRPDGEVIEEEFVYFYSKLLPRNLRGVYLESSKAGMTWRLEFNISYQEKLRGFDFTGDVSRPKLTGKSLAQLPAQRLCVGLNDCKEQISKASSRIVTEVKRLTDKRQAMYAKIGRLFNGAIVAGRYDRHANASAIAAEPHFVTREIEFDRWYFQREKPDEYQVWTQVQTKWLRNTYNVARAGEVTSLNVIIDFTEVTTLGENGPYTLRLYFRPEGERGRSVGRTLKWSGDRFYDSRYSNGYSVVFYKDGELRRQVERRF